MFFLYFGCLAHASALSEDGSKIDITHESVAMRVLESLTSIGQFCARFGRDPQPTWRAILSAYPGDVADRIISGLTE